MIRKLLLLAGRHGGRLSVIDYGGGVSIAALSPPIELVIALERDQVLELVNTLDLWLAGATPGGVCSALNSCQSGQSGAHPGVFAAQSVADARPPLNTVCHPLITPGTGRGSGPPVPPARPGPHLPEEPCPRSTSSRPPRSLSRSSSPTSTSPPAGASSPASATDRWAVSPRSGSPSPASP